MKIDVNQIEGYENMSAEEKISALESYEYDDNSTALAEALANVDKYKNANSKANSEIATMKKQAKEKLSADEKEALEKQELYDALVSENKALKRDKEVSVNKANFISLGYDSDIAEATANALVDGDIETVFKNQKIHQENMEKRLKAEMLKDSPRVDTKNGGGNAMTKADFLKLPTNEQMKYISEHPDWKTALK